MTMLETVSRRAVARPLNVLVPLIKKDLEVGDEAAKQAALPYYQSAGEKMLEAKDQFGSRAEFNAWIERNFKVSRSQADNYMKFANRIKDINFTPASFSSLDDFRRRELGQTRVPGSQREKAWQDPVKQIINRVDVETLNLRQEELKRADERGAQRALALQLIDIGYKALASKLHPDKGGSREAMSRLNQVRERLKASI